MRVPMARALALAIFSLALAQSPSHAQSGDQGGGQGSGQGVADDFRRTLQCPTRKYCTRVSTCREAVHLWCACGYEGADRDSDGVPCESLCGQSEPAVLERVARIRASLGCPPWRR